MLSLEERLRIKQQEQKEIEEIKTRVLADVRKQKTFIDYVKYYFLKFDAESGLYFGNTNEKKVYVSLGLIVIFFSTYNLLSLLYKYFVN